MGGRVNTYYFLDFEKFLQKKGTKGLYAYFGTLADCVTLMDFVKVLLKNGQITF